jgi:PEP-CTERM motif
LPRWRVEVFAAAQVFDNYPSSVLAGADPYIFIDPAFVGGIQFSLLISEGIGNGPVSAVPEPSTWAMMILGFVGIGFMAYSHDRSFVMKEGILYCRECRL